MNPYDQLQANLGRCKNGLTKWSRDNLPNFRANIAALNIELDTIQDSPPPPH